MKISVITPSIRSEIELVRQSLLKQTFPFFEWIVCSPRHYSSSDGWIVQRPKENDFYSYCKALNDLFAFTQGELIVICNDSQYLKPNVLQTFWHDYQEDKLSCVCGLGDHYRKVLDGKGIDLTYHDVRWEQILTGKSVTTLTNFDSGLCAIPFKAIDKVGYIDEGWDKYACWGDREYILKIRNMGYTLYIDTRAEFVAQQHEKKYDPHNKWGERYDEGEKLFKKRHPDVQV